MSVNMLRSSALPLYYARQGPAGMMAYRASTSLLSKSVPSSPPSQERFQLSQSRTFNSIPGPGGNTLFGSPGPDRGGSPSYFRKERLPANTIIKFVPQQTAWVVERMGRFHRILEPGLAILLPIVDKIQYVKSLKEVAIEIPSQSAITADNVTLDLDGVLYIRVFDAYKASYGVEDAEYAISQLAQTTMRSEIGQLTLDQVLKERAALNINITQALNEPASEWGVKCLRYEIRDIHAPDQVLEAMNRQVSAERSKRAEILESEGQRQSAINIAEGKKQSVILASEAKKAEQINWAAGEAQAILVKAEATARGLEAVAQTIRVNGDSAQDAVSLTVADKYVEAFGKLAKESNTIVIPAQLGDIGGMIAGAMGIYGKVAETQARQARGLAVEATEEQDKQEMEEDARAEKKEKKKNSKVQVSFGDYEKDKYHTGRRG